MLIDILGPTGCGKGVVKRLIEDVLIANGITIEPLGNRRSEHAIVIRPTKEQIVQLAQKPLIGGRAK